MPRWSDVIGTPTAQAAPPTRRPPDLLNAVLWMQQRSVEYKANAPASWPWRAGCASTRRCR